MTSSQLLSRMLRVVFAFGLLLFWCGAFAQIKERPQKKYYSWGQTGGEPWQKGTPVWDTPNALCVATFGNRGTPVPKTCYDSEGNGHDGYIQFYKYAGVQDQYTCEAAYYNNCSGSFVGGDGGNPYDGAIPVWICPRGELQGHTDKDIGWCVGPAPSKGCNCFGNPIDGLTGDKRQTERDYAGAGAFPIVLERTYHSTGSGPGIAMGNYHVNNPYNGQLRAPDTSNDYNGFSPPSGWALPPTQVSGFPPVPVPTSVDAVPTNVAIDTSWRLNYDRSLNVQFDLSPIAVLIRGDNKRRTFTWTNNVWVPDASEDMTSLTQQFDGSGNATGFTYVNENDETERYDMNGRLLSISNRAGMTQTLQYAVDPNTFFTLLYSVTDAFGRKMSFTYDGQGRLVGATDPNGGNYTYAYGSNNNLATVTYPDGNAKQYVYENAGFVTALTGIIDENGGRFATWSYDSYGNAITSEHAGGVEKYTLNFSDSTSTIVTNALGSTQVLSIQTVNDYVASGSMTQTCGTNCTRSSATTFDVNGNVASTTDFNGNVTTYSYDLTRDLEISRTEASGTAQARTITTQWHPAYRLPAVITEPGRTTTFNYDTNGNLLSKTVAAGGSSRTWTYTYNTNGQILTVTGPRTDVSDVTTYTYDTSGNLASVSNALGQVTTLSNYDGNGRAGLITDPNGATTTLSYAPRGWLTNKTVTAGNIVQSTTYSYDNAGQLMLVTLPDNSTVSYTYDAAHRLIKIQDSLGDSINYTLDLMDNRVSETVKDPNGALTRQVSRIFDTVNRLQQATGAAQ